MAEEMVGEAAEVGGRAAVDAEVGEGVVGMVEEATVGEGAVDLEAHTGSAWWVHVKHAGTAYSCTFEVAPAGKTCLLPFHATISILLVYPPYLVVVEEGKG
jgi:hypothetical protein